tara:strand:+ start:234 stop:470 length:237 start_codon:yes stop_codon:yes gene_type:complete
MPKNGKKDKNISLSKSELKVLMKQFGVTMQIIADYSGHSKTDVCRVMNEEMEGEILSTARRLLGKEMDKTQHLREMLA